MKGYKARKEILPDAKRFSPLPIVSKPKQILSDGSIYTGEWSGQKRHGQGI